MKNLSLGDRMKSYYEDRFKQFLPRRSYTLMRIDGKAFHTYTKGLERPFDAKLMDDMDATAAFLCEEIQGAQFAYVQSDEISILITDFAKFSTQAWYDGNIQKMTSVSASLATAKFNELRPGKLAFFDSRVWMLPSRSEVLNYFLWRHQDAVRNSVSSLAQSLYSHRELNKKNTDEQKKMCVEKGTNWETEISDGAKYGRLIINFSFYDKGRGGFAPFATEDITNTIDPLVPDLD